MSRLLKILVLVFGFFAISIFTPQKASATPQEFVKAVQEGNNLQWYLGGGTGMLSTTTDTLLVGITGAYDDQGNLISYGATQATSKMIASLYNKPASSVQYLAYVFNRAGLAKPALAQGGGWDFLTSVTAVTATPVLKLWELSRNVVYLFFIVVFVAIGFMIMFRSRLNPQTVVNVQLALPKIIVSLILVTFSYAISGFIIDFVFLGHNLVQAVFFVQEPLNKAVPPGSASYYDAVKNLDFVSTLLMASPGETWGGVDVFNQIARFLFNVPGLLSDVFCAFNPPPTGVCGNIATNFLPLIFAFTLLGTGLKIFFSLITKYVTLILSTIFSPFIFLLNAMPGIEGGIGNFVKTMLSAALTFPAVAFMFYLSSYFVNDAIGLNLQGLPPLNKTGILADPTSLGTFGRPFESLIALGLLMATTQVSQALDQALGVKPGITGTATPEIGGALRKIPIIGSLLG